MKKNIDDFKGIRKFISELTPVEFRCVELTMQLVDAFNNLIKRHQLSKEDFCELFNIKPTKYNDYTKGNYNYSVNDMAKLNSVHAKLEAKKIMESKLVEIAEKNKE